MTLSFVPITRAIQKRPFDCGNQALNDYFRLYAYKNDRLSIGKTIVALNDENRVVGYMTLSSAHIESESLPESIRSKLPRYPVPAFRIAKLAVDKDFHGSGIGSSLLRSALERALSVSASVGLYAVIVDAIDEQARRFYLKFGFIPFTSQALSLFLPISTIAEAYSNK